MENGNQRLGSVYHGITLLAYCGGGAYGEVYYGKDLTGRAFAVKIVMKSRIGDHWERELKGVSNYRKVTENAPDLLKIFHVEEDAENFFYTMEPADSSSETEYVPDTLATRLSHGPLPQGDVFRILSGIFSGLQTIHEAGFAHRDIKPDNILFVKGVPKLGDIGLLSSLSGTVTQLAGTLEFMPPEMRTADSDLTDRASRQKGDLYAFGKVIYCAVTGQDAHSWPAVPKDQPLTLPLKFFLRLSFLLCNPDTTRRLASVSDTAKEFAEIERKLLYGETLRDKFSYRMREMYAGFRSSLIHTGRWLWRFWWLVLILLALVGTGIWFMRPPKPFDIAQVKTQKYINKKAGFTLELPAEWTKITEASLQQSYEVYLKKHPNLNEKQKKRMELFQNLLKLGVDFYACDLEGIMGDNITIQGMPSPGTQEKIDLNVLKLYLLRQFQNSLGFKSKIYEIKEKSIAGVPYIFIDYAHNPEEHRVNTCIFVREGYIFSINLTSKLISYAKRREQLDAILKTIKFFR